MKNRQAIVPEFGPPEVITIVEADLPEPLPGQVRVRIEASTVSATDIFIRKGIYPLLKGDPPFVLGFDFVGIVDKVASDVTFISLGDRVGNLVMTGGNANYICCPADQLVRIPPDVDLLSVAPLMLSGMTAYQLFTRAATVKPGSKLLIHGGSGAVGDTLLQLGRLASCVMVTTASAGKHELLASYGATPVDYHASNYREQLRTLAGEGFDFAFDFTNQISFNDSFRLLKKGGRLITYGVFTSALSIAKKTPLNFASFGIDYGLMMAKLAWWNALPNGKSARFFGSPDSKRNFPAQYQQDFDELAGLLKKGHLIPPIYQVVAIDEIPLAHRLLQDGQIQGHLVVDMRI